MKYLKNLCYCLCILAVTFAANAQSKPNGCPRNLDGKSFITLKNKMPKNKGNTVAFDSEVIRIEKGFNDKPYFQVKFDNGETIWISSMIVGNYVAKGRKLRILGYIDEVAKDDEIGQKYNAGGLQVLAFALLDLESKNLQISDAFHAEAQEWLAGRMPKKRD